MQEQEEEWKPSYYAGLRFRGQRVFRMSTTPEAKAKGKEM